MKEKPTDGVPAAWLYAEAPSRPQHESQLVGKWQMFVPPDRIDSAWKAIANRIEAGELGMSGKVSTGGSRIHASDDSFVIIAYAVDWRDISDLRRMLRVIRAEGFTSPIYFKRDVETRAKAYRTPAIHGDGMTSAVVPPVSSLRKTVSVWGSPEAGVIQTKWVNGKTWTVVTAENAMQIIALITQQDSEIRR